MNELVVYIRIAAAVYFALPTIVAMLDSPGREGFSGRRMWADIKHILSKSGSFLKKMFTFGKCGGSAQSMMHKSYWCDI